jgi:hypothetical protein
VSECLQACKRVLVRKGAQLCLCISTYTHTHTRACAHECNNSILKAAHPLTQKAHGTSHPRRRFSQLQVYVRTCCPFNKGLPHALGYVQRSLSKVHHCQFLCMHVYVYVSACVYVRVCICECVCACVVRRELWQSPSLPGPVHA